jgi:hypothetical protein
MACGGVGETKDLQTVCVSQQPGWAHCLHNAPGLVELEHAAGDQVQL